MKDYIEKFTSNNPNRQVTDWTELVDEPIITKYQEELQQNLDGYKNLI